MIACCFVLAVAITLSTFFTYVIIYLFIAFTFCSTITPAFTVVVIYSR